MQIGRRVSGLQKLEQGRAQVPQTAHSPDLDGRSKALQAHLHLMAAERSTQVKASWTVVYTRSSSRGIFNLCGGSACTGCRSGSSQNISGKSYKGVNLVVVGTLRREGLHQWYCLSLGAIADRQKARERYRVCHLAQLCNPAVADVDPYGCAIHHYEFMISLVDLLLNPCTHPSQLQG
jgi:hypothetical protein